MMLASAHIKYVKLPFPQKGTEQLLSFTTRVEKKDAKGRLDVDLHKRKAQIVYMGSKEYKHRFQVFLFESEFELTAALDPFNLLLTRMSYVLDECFVETNEACELEKVLNLEFIQYRWRTVRARLLPDFEGEKFQPYFEEMEARMKDQEALLNYLRLPSMYGMYFNGYRKPMDTLAPTVQVVQLGAEAQHLTLQEDIQAQKTLYPESQVVELTLQGKQWEKLKRKEVVLEDIQKKQRVLDNFLVGVELPRYELEEKPAIEETPPAKTLLKGQFTYLDGFLYQGEKQVETDIQNISYTVKWVGLRKVLPQ